MLLKIVVIIYFTFRWTEGALNGCNMKPQWSARMTNIVDMAKGSQKVVDFYYDYINNRLATQTRYLNGTKLERTVVNYTNKTRTYIFSGISKQPCQETPTGPSEVLLSPAQTRINANITGYFGKKPGTHLNFNAYLPFPFGDQRMTIFVSLPDCVPVIATIVGGFLQANQELVLVYSDYVENISDPYAFDTSSCQRSNLSKVKQTTPS